MHILKGKCFLEFHSEWGLFSPDGDYYGNRVDFREFSPGVNNGIFAMAILKKKALMVAIELLLKRDQTGSQNYLMAVYSYE